RVQMVRQVIPPIGNCRTDSDILLEISRHMGYTMHYDSPAEIMEEIALLAPIYGGMHHDRLNSSWGLQWPCWDRDHTGTPFLHKYFFTRGKGKFVPAEHVPPAELPDKDYPFTLNTGRIYHHYHTGTMTRKSHTLNRECNEALLEINPQDAANHQIRTGDQLLISSRRGSIHIKAQVTEQVCPGSVYTTFHFAEAPINHLTLDCIDPESKCPEYKLCAVKLEKVLS
ncbi:molybdopterin oxidoreductase family protein, partial [Thermodesulfobacteriota bacterium]